jgi:hypothetical protein
VRDFYSFLADRHRDTLEWVAAELNDILTSPDTRYQLNVPTMKRLNAVVRKLRGLLASPPA